MFEVIDSASIEFQLSHISLLRTGNIGTRYRGRGWYSSAMGLHYMPRYRLQCNSSIFQSPARDGEQLVYT